MKQVQISEELMTELYKYFVLFQDDEVQYHKIKKMVLDKWHKMEKRYEYSKQLQSRNGSEDI